MSHDETFAPVAQQQQAPHEVDAFSNPGKSTLTQRVGEEADHRESVLRSRAIGEEERLAATAGSAAEPVSDSTASRVTAAVETTTSPTTMAIQSKGSGEALPENLSSAFGEAYGTDFSGVRVHTDARAHSAARAQGAEAFTYGKDVFFADGVYDTESRRGQFILGHELAHVAQQGDHADINALLADEAEQSKVESGEDGAVEAEASAAANIALSGGRTTLRATTGRVRYFKQGDGSESQGGHAYMTEQALQKMLEASDPDKYGGKDGKDKLKKDAKAGRYGNWERDFSQALTPGTMGLMGPIIPILNIMSIKEFGRGINLATLGTYDPVEHLDNPALLRGDGAFAQGGMPKLGDMINQADTQTQGADGKVKTKTIDDLAKEATQLKKDVAEGGEGAGDKAWADVDKRYADTPTVGMQKVITAPDGTVTIKKVGDAKKVMNPKDAAAYQVDQSGIPRYLQTGRNYLTTKLKQAAREGTEGDGPTIFGSASHIMQDYFAHSNFCEIGLNILIQSGELVVKDESGADIKVSVEKHGKLDTQVHANLPNGQVAAQNLTVPKGMGGDGREVLTTGTFTLTDTLASVLEEVSDKWKQMNPFQKGKKGPSELMLACLDYMDMNGPTDFTKTSAPIVSILTGAKTVVSAVAPTATKVVDKAGQYGSEAIKKGGGILEGGLDLLNKANAKLGGDADYFDGTKAKVHGAADSASSAVSEEAKAITDGIKGINDKLDDAIKSMKEGHALRKIYTWAYENNPVKLLIDAAKKIPVVGTTLGEKLEEISNNVRDAAETALGVAWNYVIDKGTEKLNGVISAVRGNTNTEDLKKQGKTGQEAGWSWLPTPVRKFFGEKKGAWERFKGGVGDMYDDAGNPKNGIAPGSYTPPSHTEVAKDHGDLSQGARDGQADGPNDPKSKKEDPDHQTKDTKNPNDAKHGADQHGHVHKGAFLSGVASTLASMATQAIGAPVAAAWKTKDKSGGTDAAIETAVNTYFNHPADSGFWRGPVKAAAGTKELGPEILKHLQKGPGSPATPNPMEVRKENKHGEAGHDHDDDHDDDHDHH